jgi:hypothetical protein
MKLKIIIFLLLVILILSICLIIFASIASIAPIASIASIAPINILKYGGGIEELENEIIKQQHIYKTEIEHLTEYIKHISNIQILDENIKQELIEDIYKKLGTDIPIGDIDNTDLGNKLSEGLSNDIIINSIKESIQKSINDTIKDPNKRSSIIKELQLKKIL